jgi:hypothetical protein
MKKSLFILLCTALLSSCNQSPDKSKDDKHLNHDIKQTTELALNNGAKWKADSVTNHNVANLRSIADNFKIKSTSSVSSYQKLSANLNTGLNKMIKECKMTGADHDALHMWLQPILEENAELKNISDPEIAGTIFKSIDKRLDNYNNYFK